VSDAGQYRSGSDGVTITTIALLHEHDLIVLRRRLREAADELNFDRRDIGRLSTAAYESARQLFGAGASVTAELRVVASARPSRRARR